MKITEVKNAIRVGEVVIGKSQYGGKRHVLYKNKLEIIYDDNFPKELRRKHVSLIYIFVVNGIIYKIGQSSSNSGIEGCMTFYLIAGQDDSGPNRFMINYLIRNEIENGNKVEVYMKYMDMIEIEVDGLLTKEVIKVPVSAKAMEELAIAEYVSVTGMYPKWNYQESRESPPPIIEQVYHQYKTRRAKNKTKV